MTRSALATRTLPNRRDRNADATLPPPVITPTDILRAVYATSRTVPATEVDSDAETATICRGYN